MKELNRIKFFHLTCMLDLCLFFLFQSSRVEEKSVIKIFYDNDRGGEARSGAFNPCFGTLWFCGH